MYVDKGDRMSVGLYATLALGSLGLIVVAALVLYKLYTMRVFLKGLLFKFIRTPFVRVDVIDPDTRTVRSKYIRLPKDMKQREVIVDGIRRKLDYHGAFIDAIFQVPAYVFVGDNYEPVKLDNRTFTSQPIDAKTLDSLLFFYYSLGKTQAEKKDDKVLQYVEIGLIVGVITLLAAGGGIFYLKGVLDQQQAVLTKLQKTVDKIAASPLFSNIQTDQVGQPVMITNGSQQKPKAPKEPVTQDVNTVIA